MPARPGASRAVPAGPLHDLTGALRVAVPFDVRRIRDRLEMSGGGVQLLHTSPGLEIRVESCCELPLGRSDLPA